RKGSDDLLKEINAVIKETKDSGKFDQWLKEASTYKQSK
ncbi:MAG: amino acid ABC transporter substrate-binding protein, partial [Streptococcus salivarius]